MAPTATTTLVFLFGFLYISTWWKREHMAGCSKADQLAAIGQQKGRGENSCYTRGLVGAAVGAGAQQYHDDASNNNVRSSWVRSRRETKHTNRVEREWGNHGNDAPRCHPTLHPAIRTSPVAVGGKGCVHYRPSSTRRSRARPESQWAPRSWQSPGT